MSEALSGAYTPTGLPKAYRTARAYSKSAREVSHLLLAKPEMHKQTGTWTQNVHKQRHINAHKPHFL